MEGGGRTSARSIRSNRSNKYKSGDNTTKSLNRNNDSIQNMERLSQYVLND